MELEIRLRENSLEQIHLSPLQLLFIQKDLFEWLPCARHEARGWRHHLFSPGVYVEGVQGEGV